eukprot:COSAG06_NODE_4032_length_4641_cov_3.410172_5_plen_201_part_01
MISHAGARYSPLAGLDAVGDIPLDSAPAFRTLCGKAAACARWRPHVCPVAHSIAGDTKNHHGESGAVVVRRPPKLLNQSLLFCGTGATRTLFLGPHCELTLTEAGLAGLGGSAASFIGVIVAGGGLGGGATLGASTSSTRRPIGRRPRGVDGSTPPRERMDRPGDSGGEALRAPPLSGPVAAVANRGSASGASVIWPGVLA